MLTQNEITALLALIETHGERKASELIGISISTLQRAVPLSISAASETKVRSYLTSQRPELAPATRTKLSNQLELLTFKEELRRQREHERQVQREAEHARRLAEREADRERRRADREEQEERRRLRQEQRKQEKIENDAKRKAEKEAEAAAKRVAKTAREDFRRMLKYDVCLPSDDEVLIARDKELAEEQAQATRDRETQEALRLAYCPSKVITKMDERKAYEALRTAQIQSAQSRDTSGSALSSPN